MSSRDFNPNFNSFRRNRSRSRDRFPRPAPSRTGPGDYSRDRDRDRYHERDDRYHDRDPRDRDRDRRNDRDRDLDLSRTYPPPQDQPAKMDPDRASAELVKAFRQISDFMAQKTQLVLKKDAELKTLHKRKQDYERQISGPVQFPAVQDAFQQIQNHHKSKLADIDKELATLTPKEDAAFNKYAHTLVRALPIDEIKIRQFLETARGEPGPVTTSSQSAQDERLKKLEQRQAGFEETWKKQIASLKEMKEKQAMELAGYREKDRLRADAAKENEQLRAEVASLRSEITALTKRVELVEPVESFRQYVDKQVDSLKAELSKELVQVKSESIANKTQGSPDSVPDAASHQEMVALGQECGKLSREIEDLRKTSGSHTEQIAVLDTGVKNHEVLLANIDVEGLEDVMNDYTALSSRVTGQDMAIDDVKRSVAQCLGRIPEKMPADLPASFKAWSDRFLEFCGTKLDEHTKQIKSLEECRSTMGNMLSAEAALAQASRPAIESTSNIGTSLTLESEAVGPRVTSAESRLTELESKTVTIDSKVTALQEPVSALQNSSTALRDSITTLGSQADQRYGALETMVESLSSQWSNMNTTQMAHLILEQLSRLQPAQLVPEIRHFQERLADVEKIVQEDGEQRKNLTKGMRSICDDIGKTPKRSLASEEKYPGRQEKRARIDGQNGVNGYGNGFAHP
ncbi:hypothetical protein J7T55_006843 [Diaporthe amygdali]|uniref:uncharacterized protein n=1 Tax=Phomopsis amygdali TaxID=1214568 RepID=UPI0022FEBE30|nr:uncharacterized protein J7T55_006843 [Diaporthe amygdali]KAJ0125494.1 hypothetical protein J7T55_006843 [Diaporthe amygdali]